jgi:hypothetical protein
LKVGGSGLGTLEIIGLVVEDNRVGLRLVTGDFCLGSLHEITNRLAAAVCTVITPDDDYGAVDDGSIVDKQVDAGIAIELLRARFAGVILVVAQTGVDGC